MFWNLFKRKAKPLPHYHKRATAYKEVYANHRGEWVARIYSYDKALGLLEEFKGENDDRDSALRAAHKAADKALKPYLQEG